MKRPCFVVLLFVIGLAMTSLAGDLKEQSYRSLKFSVVGVDRMKAYDGKNASQGNEFVVVKTIVDRSNFEEDSRGNECKLDRAKLLDVNDNSYRSNEQERRITLQLKDEYGRTYGDAKITFEWSFEVPAGTKWKTFRFEFADEHVFTGGNDPDENVSSLSFDISNR